MTNIDQLYQVVQLLNKSVQHQAPRIVVTLNWLGFPLDG